MSRCRKFINRNFCCSLIYCTWYSTTDKSPVYLIVIEDFYIFFYLPFLLGAWVYFKVSLNCKVGSSPFSQRSNSVFFSFSGIVCLPLSKNARCFFFLCQVFFFQSSFHLQESQVPAVEPVVLVYIRFIIVNVQLKPTYKYIDGKGIVIL